MGSVRSLLYHRVLLSEEYGSSKEDQRPQTPKFRSKDFTESIGTACFTNQQAILHQEPHDCIKRRY